VKTSAIRVNWRTGNKRWEKEGTAKEIIDKNAATVEIHAIVAKYGDIVAKYGDWVAEPLVDPSDCQHLKLRI
jgi:hypothetical protein